MAREQIQHLPRERFKTVPQLRTLDPEKVGAMSQSMTEVGQLQPIRGRSVEGNIVVTDGHYRLAAATLAGLPTVAVIVEEKELNEGEIVHRQLVANCQRVELSCMQKSRAIARLMSATQWSASQAAQKLGLSNSMVTRHLALLELSPEIQARIEAGEISASAAYGLAQVDDAALRSDMADQVAHGKLTRDDVNRAVKRARRPPMSPAASTLTRATAILGPGRSITVCGADLTLESLIESLDELRARAVKVRPQNLQLATFLKMLKDQAKSRKDTSC